MAQRPDRASAPAAAANFYSHHIWHKNIKERHTAASAQSAAGAPENLQRGIINILPLPWQRELQGSVMQSEWLVLAILICLTAAEHIDFAAKPEIICLRLPFSVIMPSSRKQYFIDSTSYDARCSCYIVLCLVKPSFIVVVGVRTRHFSRRLRKQQ